MKDVASSKLYTDTEILMDVQEEIKALIKQAVFNVYYMISFNERVERVIENGLKDIDDEEFKTKMRNALRDFAQREYRLSMQALNLGVVPLLLAGQSRKDVDAVIVKSFIKDYRNIMNSAGVSQYNKLFNQLGNSQAKVDRFGMSIYGYSEMRLRYEEQQGMINSLKSKKLVMCDSHVDCSDRCSKWQGRVYSMDGTSGTTKDGKKYIPLEVAINDETYGKHNGLFGYNCRHKIYEYHDGMSEIKVNEAERKRENDLTRIQRLLEREIRTERSLANAFKDDVKGTPYAFTQLSERKYNLHNSNAQRLTKEYKAFCKKYNRVEYRSRLVV